MKNKMKFKMPELIAPQLQPLAPEGVVAHYIVSLMVDTDSVVATLTLKLSVEAEQVLVYWGDGTYESQGVTPSALGNRWKHAYEASDDGKAFDQNIFVVVQNRNGTSDVRVQAIRLVPRYRVSLFPSSIRLTSPCDPSYERENEFRITMAKPDNTRLDWSWNPSNNWFPSPWFPLGGSGWQGELVPDEDEYSASLLFLLTEGDTFSDDEGVAAASVAWNEPEGEKTRAFIVGDGWGRCTVELRYYRRSILLRPNLQGPVVVGI